MKTILFFNGFTLTENDISLTNDNIIYINGIVTKEIIESLKNKYQNSEILIVGFSFGCHYANLLIKEFKAIGKEVTSIAICGTPNPVHRKYGIHPTVIKKMANELSEQTMKQFYELIDYDKITFDILDAKNELLTIIGAANNQVNYFQYAILASDDKIFALPKIEVLYENKIVLNSNHFIFRKEKNIEIIQEIFSNPEKFFSSWKL